MVASGPRHELLSNRVFVGEEVADNPEEAAAQAVCGWIERHAAADMLSALLHALKVYRVDRLDAVGTDEVSQLVRERWREESRRAQEESDRETFERLREKYGW